MIADFNLIHLSSAESVKAYTLMLAYSKSHGLAIPDALIAATAIIQGLELASDNERHFKMIPNLAVKRPYWGSGTKMDKTAIALGRNWSFGQDNVGLAGKLDKRRDEVQSGSHLTAAQRSYQVWDRSFQLVTSELSVVMRIQSSEVCFSD